MFNNNNNNPYGKAVKEEEELMRSISSYSQYDQQQQPFMLINPTAMDELQYDTGVTPFLTKTYELVDDQTTNQVVSWSKGNNSFVIWDPQVFSINILPRYFKHNNFSSFVRQLNTYGFRKVDVDIWEFANEDFLRGQKHLLRAIKRKKPPPYPPPHHHQPSSQNQDRPCVEIGRFNLDQEIDRLRRDKQVLMSELVRIRQQQHHTKSYLKEMETRLQKTENKQQQMMTFLSKALQNPNFLDQMIQIEKRKDFEDALMQNKRRRPIDHHHHHHQGQCSNNNIGFGNPGFLHENMYVLANEHNGKMVNNVGGEERLFDERFWEGVEDEIDVLRVDQSQNVGYLHEGLLAQHFGYLDPNMP